MMSISSEELDTHRLHIKGPVISKSSVIAGVVKDTPVLVLLPCVLASDELEATPALVAPLVE